MMGMDFNEYENQEPRPPAAPKYYPGEYDGEDAPETVVKKITKIKAGALFPEDCPMDDKVIKSESAMYAKNILRTISTENGTSLYDHLCAIVRQLIDERVPGNKADFIEELSAQTKLKRYGMMWKDPDSTWRELTQNYLSDSDKFLKVWKKNANWASDSGGGDEETEYNSEYPNMLQTQYYLEHINFGFPKEEAYRIALSMRNFLRGRNVDSPRFWGKIFCTQRSYYVIEVAITETSDVETDMWIPPRTSADNDVFDGLPTPIGQDSYNTLGAEETLERAGKSVTNPQLLAAYDPKNKALADAKPPSPPVELFNPKMEMMGEDGEYYGEGDSLFQKKQPAVASEVSADNRLWEMYQRELAADFPKAVQFPEPPIVPAERQGLGVNRKAFYVCNDLNENWTLLPLVTPQQINGSRTIRWALTGDLNAKVQTYPPFPGREGHYLRALLARITAGSQISPKGFYKSIKSGDEDEKDYSDSEEEDEEEEITRQVFGNDGLLPASNFRVPKMRSLLTTGGLGWVHHSSMILRQGRTVWHSTIEKKRNDDESENESEMDDEEDGEGSEYDYPKREIPLPLFTSLGQDTFPDNLSNWSVRSSSEVFTELQIAGIRSNVWNGAVAYCTQKGKMENIYIGDGLKFGDRSWAPHFTDIIQMEYPEGPELRELPDPPIEIEQEWLNAIIEAQQAKENKIAASKHVESYYDENIEDDYGSSEEEMGYTTEEEEEG